MSEIRTFGFQTVPKSKRKPVQISARSDFGHSGFLGHTQNVQISDTFFSLKSKLFSYHHDVCQEMSANLKYF